jgi:hypothetical protein
MQGTLGSGANGGSVQPSQMAEGLHGAVCPCKANAATKEVLTDHSFGSCADRRLARRFGCALDNQGSILLGRLTHRQVAPSFEAGARFPHALV